MSKNIKSTQGKFIIVDDNMFDELNQYRWCVNKKGKTYYAERREKGFLIRIHRQILNLKCGDEKIVDHINHNGLDNRNSNLRIVNKAENCRNHNGNKNNTSGYNGVCWFKRDKKWKAQIMVNYKNMHLGYYDDINDAVESRRQGEIKYWGEV